MPTKATIRKPRVSDYFDNAVDGMYVRADERLAKRLADQGKHSQSAAALDRVKRRRARIFKERS